jgi:hypothetical protein
VGVAQEQIVAVVIPAVEEVTRYLDHLPPQAEVAEPHGTAEIHKITQVVQVAEHAKEVQSWVLEILPQYPLRKDFQVAHKVAELDHITHRAVAVAQLVEAQTALRGVVVLADQVLVIPLYPEHLVVEVVEAKTAAALKTDQH